jgi:C1A family cysteine protease
VYKPSRNARFEFGHAIVLIGYDNEQGFWLAKNSYGSNWGDGGNFRVSSLSLKHKYYSIAGLCAACCTQR